MKKLILIVLSLLLLSACGGGNENVQEAVYVNITAQQAKKIMDEQKNYIILDTRTQEEYDTGHIPGAILIPYDEILEKADRELIIPMNEHCESLNAAIAAAIVMWQMKL